jgi:hypothetical protein
VLWQEGKVHKLVEMLISWFTHNEANMDIQKQDYEDTKTLKQAFGTHSYVSNAYLAGKVARRVFLLKPLKLKMKLTTKLIR